MTENSMDKTDDKKISWKLGRGYFLINANRLINQEILGGDFSSCLSMTITVKRSMMLDPTKILRWYFLMFETKEIKEILKRSSLKWLKN